MEFADLPAEFQEVGLRVIVTFDLTETPHGRCRRSMPIGEVSLLDDSASPAPELLGLHEAVVDAVNDLSIAGRVWLRSAHIEISEVDASEADALREALGEPLGMLVQHYDRRDEEVEGPGMISVWPLADF